MSESLLCLLTEDLLVRVLHHLHSDADRKSWRLVCKHLNRVESITRTTIRILRIEFLLALLHKFRNIQELDLSLCPRIDDGAVKVMLSQESPGWTRGLKRLVLSRATGLGHSGLEQLVRACPLLEAVDVSHCWGFGDREAAAISCGTRLREVNMDKCLGVTDIGLARIAVGCSRLERLSLKWCFEISDLGVDLLCKKCFYLKVLDVSYLKSWSSILATLESVEVTSESLRSIASLLYLEVLVMVGCSLVDDVGLRYLENGCPLLKTIDVSRCNCISSSGLISLVSGHVDLVQIGELSGPLVHCLKNLEQLSAIRIDGVRVSDFFLQTIGKNCKFIVELGLSKCIGVTNMGILHLVSGCGSLKILDLTCCRSITDAAISTIADSCPDLVCLRLESCDMVTENCIYHLGSNCLLLEELDLTDCSGINDIALKYLSGCSELVRLKLGLCTNISDIGLSQIAYNCRKMAELDLYRCVYIGDDGLAALASGCKKLMKLNVSYCNRITDKGMEYLSHLGELSELEMRGLSNVTSIGIKAVALSCKRLADLDLKHCEKIDDSGFWALAFYSQNLRQINLSNCNVSDVVLCLMMGNLKRLQDAKLVHLFKVTVKGVEHALRACCGRIKKVKLHSSLRFLIAPEILDTFQARGCKVRWD
ncbi:F-box/LRR-repeat protein 3 isoform X2 [Arachis duranensis]|uniref:F-box/LRR-repeat protein 3 isoform X2 n=1 Tax=Arachis duranensis TaxID=130453 RepID=A0A9C6TLB2_ARADU|nr:F-box/LRR-repeat protein 3 isoform X2 [Arachis duranensis]